MLHGKTTFSQTTRSIISVLSSLAFPLGGPCSFIERHVFERKSFPSRMTTVIKQTIGGRGSTPPSINNFPPLESIFDSFRSTRYFAHPSAHPFQTRVSSQYSSQRHIKGSRLPFPEIRAVNEKGIDLRKRLRSAKGCVSEELLCAVP